jgi:tripartite-type tricarboxylate transporter receptor subunit TctC
MKKICILICLIGMALNIAAKETVTIYYPFGVSDSMTNWGRTLVEEANKSQDQYTFLFDFKPGAGNAIAALHVSRTPNTIIMTSPALFIRPIFYPNESYYDVKSFRPLLAQCAAPLVITSTRYKSWDEVPVDKPLNMAVTGTGTTTHFAGLQVANKYRNIQLVPFKSTTDSMLALVSGNVDFSVGFLAAAEAWSINNKGKSTVNILGVTGSKVINGYPTLISQGFPLILSSMAIPHALYISTDVNSDKKYNELRKILVKSSNTASVLNSYKPDHCYPLSDMLDKELQDWFNMQSNLWKDLSNKVPKE